MKGPRSFTDRRMAGMGVQKEHATSNPKSALGATGRLSWWSVRLLVLAQGCGMEARVGLRAWWGGVCLRVSPSVSSPPINAS